MFSRRTCCSIERCGIDKRKGAGMGVNLTWRTFYQDGLLSQSHTEGGHPEESCIVAYPKHEILTHMQLA